MNGLGIGDCLKRFLCCFPRVYAWFLSPNGTATALGNDYLQTYDNRNIYCGNYSTPPAKTIPPSSSYLNGITFDSQEDWKFVAGCGNRSYGIKQDGSLWGWGEGPLGDGTVDGSPVPVLIDSGEWKFVSPATSHTLAIKEDGTLWSWGENDWGQLGTGCSRNKMLSMPFFYRGDFRASLSSSVSHVTIREGGTYSLTPSVRFEVKGYSEASRDSYGASGAAGFARMSYSLWGKPGPSYYRICNIDDAGSGYTHVPSVKVISESPPKTQPELAVVVSFSVLSVEVSDGGQGYTSPPSLSVVGMSDFSAEATVLNGRVVSVSLLSGGQGYKRTSFGDSSPQRARITVSGGGGTGAVLLAVLGNGFIDLVEIRNAGTGFIQPPTLELQGGGGAGARISAASRGSVVGVTVTNGGSGYTTIDNGGFSGNGAWSDYRVEAVFERQADDLFTYNARGIASIAPAKVTPLAVEPSYAQNFESNYFKPDQGLLGAFQITQGFRNETTIEAKIIGGGLTWETGISLTQTELARDAWGYKSVRFDYDGASSHEFTDRPYVQLKASTPMGIQPFYRFWLGYTLPGTDPLGTIERAVTEEQNEFYAVAACSNDGFVRRTDTGVYTTRSGDLFGLANNTIRSGLLGDIWWYQQWSFGGITGSPSVSFTGDAKASLLINFEGNCIFTIDDPGSKTIQWKLGTPSTAPSYCVHFDPSDEFRCKSFGLTLDVQSAVYDPPPERLTLYADNQSWTVGGPPDPRKEVISLSGDYEVTPSVSYATEQVPDSSWKAPRSAAGRIYAVFGSGRDQGCFEILPTGLRVVREGGYFTKEPMCSFVGSVYPEMQNIPGEWEKAEASPGGTARSTALKSDGDIYRWGGGGFWSQHPASIGRPAVLSVEWNHDSMPAGTASWYYYGSIYYQQGSRYLGFSLPIGSNGYTVAGDSSGLRVPSRLLTIGKPEAPGYHTSATIGYTSRRCDEYRFYPDELPKNFRWTYPPSNSDSGPIGGFTVVTKQPGPHLNEFTSEPLTSYQGGSGYYSPPTIHVDASGDPVVSVSAELKEVPSFSDFSSSLAMTSAGELWSLTGGYRIAGSDLKLLSRKASASASDIFDSVIADVQPRSVAVKALNATEDCPGSKFTDVAGPSVGVGFGYYGYYLRLNSESTTSVSHETLESVDVVTGHLIFIDDGGSGFDNYSTWVMRVRLTDAVTVESTTEKTEFGDDRAKIDGYTRRDGSEVPEQTAEYIRNSWTHSVETKISYYNRGFARLGFSPWMGSLIPSSSFYEYVAPAFGVSNCFWISGRTSQYSTSSAVKDDELEIDFVCESGNASYESLPAYRVVPVRGVLDREYGQCKVDGSWSDFTIQDDSRRLGVVAIEGCQGFMAPGEEANFVKIRGDVGLKPDGSLWRLGSPGLSPSRVMGNLELKVASPGKGYRAPALAEVPQPHAGVAKATATFDGKVVAVGIDNQGAGYRSPPQLTVSGGAQLQAVILGPVDSMTVTNGGSGYKNPPRVIFSAPGVSASGKASMKGSVASVRVVDGGEGYSAPPTISMGGNATATATIKGYIQGVIVNEGGIYSSAPSVNFSGGGGSGATAVAVMARSGNSLRVSSVVVTNTGSNYTSSPTVSFSGDGSGGAATAVLNASVDSVSLTSGGSGYGDHPAVTADGPARTQAKIAATCSLDVESVSVVDGGSYRSAPTASFEPVGEISSVSITSGGGGYSSTPEVKILGGLGSGAGAACTISASIQSFAITNRGRGYLYPPYVLISGGRRPRQSTQAKATAVLAGGSIASISVDVGGSGYYEQPTVAFKFPESAIANSSVSSGSVSGVQVLSGGCYYTDPPQVVFEGTGTGAAATAQVQDGVVTSVSITSGGSGYSTPPRVSFFVPKGGGGAAAAAVLSGVVDSISLVSCGVNYDQDALPEVLFIGGGGSGASASLSVAKSGSGGAATTTINGSVIYAAITGQGSGYQDEPTVTVSESTNFILQKASQDYSAGLIGEEEYNEIRSTSAAVVRAGITGKVTGVSVDSGGENYVPGTGRSHDQHGRRKPSRAVLRGPTTHRHGNAAFGVVCESQTSSSQRGGGEITSIGISSADFVRKPSVHFVDSIGVSLSTRLKVSSVGVMKGSSLETSRNLNVITTGTELDFSYRPSAREHNILADFGEPFEYINGAEPDTYGCNLVPSGGRGMVSKKADIVVNTHDFICDSFKAIYLHGEYVRPPRLCVESSKGARQEWQLPQSVSFLQQFALTGSTRHSSDCIGMVIDPGVLKVLSPAFEVTVSSGKVVSVSATGTAKQTEFAGELIVHGGGGVGAKLSFSISGETMTVYVIDGGSGYVSQPSVKWVLPQEAYGPTLFGLPTYPLSEKMTSFPATAGNQLIGTSGGELIEYITGSTHGGYISSRGNYPITQNGVYPFFADGFVTDAYLMDAGYPTQDFNGPAFLKHYTSPPSVAVTEGSPEEQASVQSSVVKWTDKFSGKDGLCVAVRDTTP